MNKQNSQKISPLEEYYEEIKTLRELAGFTYQKIQDYLNEKYGIKPDRSNIRRFLLSRNKRFNKSNNTENITNNNDNTRIIKCDFENIYEQIFSISKK